MTTIGAPSLAPQPPKPNVILALKQIAEASHHCSALINALTMRSEYESKTVGHINSILFTAVHQAAVRLIDVIEMREAWEAKQPK